MRAIQVCHWHAPVCATTSVPGVPTLEDDTLPLPIWRGFQRVPNVIEGGVPKHHWVQSVDSGSSELLGRLHRLYRFYRFRGQRPLGDQPVAVPVLHGSQRGRHDAGHP